jgi:predicted aconitase
MKLAPDEKRMLDGAEGSARQKAMQLLTEYGDALGAESFLDTNNVHLLIGFHFYPDVLLSKLALDDIDAFVSRSVLNSDERVVVDRVKAFTTMHITSMDIAHWDLQQATRAGDPANFRDLVVGIEEYCKRIGVAITSTCCPYSVGNLPVLGEHCVWCESSAIGFANSVLGARTNIDGDHSTFASALTGKTPKWGYHLDENRHGTFLVDVQYQPETILDWDLMGYQCGFKAGNKAPIFDGIGTRPSMYSLMAMSGSMTVTGAVCLFHIVGVTPEAQSLKQATGGRQLKAQLTYGPEDRRAAYERVNTARSDAVEYVVMGCPHYNPERLAHVARLLRGRKVNDNVKLLIFTAAQHKTLAARSGWLDIYEQAGAHLLVDSCPLHAKIPPASVVAMDSAKMSHQGAGEQGWTSVWVGSAEECIDAAVSGKWRGELK